MTVSWHKELITPFRWPSSEANITLCKLSDMGIMSQTTGAAGTERRLAFCSYCFCNYEVSLYTISLYAYIFLYYIIFTEIQLGVRCFKSLICINSFNSHDNPMRSIDLWSSFQGLWGTERWGSAPKDTQLVCGGGRVWTPKSGSGILLITCNSWFLILIQSFHLICN